MLRRFLVVLLLISFMALPIFAADNGKEIYQRYPMVEEQLGYSQAVKVGSILYISGTVGVDAYGKFPADMKSQLEFAYRNIGLTLKEFKAGFGDVVMERIYTTDIAALSRDENLAVRKAFYNGDYPAATWVEVKRLYGPSAMVEIEVTAQLK
ncbi:MAG TPA: Rid family hydrolase [Bacillota bacterium]|nr:Rid family hydrolase [Bacillota bacterium]